MKTTPHAVVVVAATLACLLAMAPASAAPAEDATAATTMSPLPASASPVGPIGQALDQLAKEAPERVKHLQDNFRKSAGAFRERVRDGISRVIGAGAAGMETTTKVCIRTEVAGGAAGAGLGAAVQPGTAVRGARCAHAWT